MEGPGTIIGRYKLLEKIGEGGMAVVYMAEQQEPIRRKVALKIIKLGMDTRQVIARFEAERQALAIMDHPNIAKVHDAGATETGRPYFVMELVTGVPITQYCDKNRLSTKDRLALFLQVCNAVQHAHEKGVVHRDIKPSNVMVAHHDGKPVPKVIDFGIAKATNQKLTEKTLFTRYAHIIGTPAYMSPEQAELSDLGIDARSDIYSLGVLLYELLTGTTPFGEEELRQAGYLEMQRIIREEEPAKPSTKLSTLGETLTDIAKRRGCTPDLLTKTVRGDLDWIVMKALEKDRARRYEGASDLALDIERHLEHRPVIARAPSVVYRLGKLLRRNRGGVAAILVLAVGAVIVIGPMISSRKNRLRIAEAESLTHNKLLSQAHIFYRNGQYGAVLEQIRSILDSRHVGKQAHALRALVLENVREELERYSEGIETHPEEPDNYYYRAQYYTHLGEHAEARSDMAQYITLATQDRESVLQLDMAERLGATVNSANLADHEWLPRVSIDGLSLSFFRNSDEQWEVWVSKRVSSQGPWEPAVRDVVGEGPDGVVLGATPLDGLEFYVWGNRPGGYGKSDILVRERKTINSAWSAPRNIGRPVNTHFSELLPNISLDGLELYFCDIGNRPGGCGGMDLWVARRTTRNGSWQKPENLGSKVNSPAADGRPHISADGLTLFFDSNRSGGMGGFDLYLARRKTLADPWEEAVNLGPRVNSPLDEQNPGTSPDCRELYFNHNHDIWRVRVISLESDLDAEVFADPNREINRSHFGKEVVSD
jgi:serine/threonine protein kinase